MPQIEISEEMQSQITAYRPIIEAVIEDTMTDQACAEFLLVRGVQAALHDLLSQQSSETLLQTIQKLGSLFPERVYWFVTEALKQGAIIAAEEQKEMMRPYGFNQGHQIAPPNQQGDG